MLRKHLAQAHRGRAKIPKLYSHLKFFLQGYVEDSQMNQEDMG